ncbi:hypothetical protein [Dictyobacter formicarum]|uniref:hypothetical protein n=1 Tax=Dictyobacter formicarum TaxID=2778368 RepID=UPI0019154211|nr:hypothetical protein [Dictyobacter formicarum]
MTVSNQPPEIQQKYLAPQDFSILTLVMQQRAIRLDQMVCFLTACKRRSHNHPTFSSKSSIHNRIEHLQREGLLNLEQIEQGQPAWMWLTKQGVHILGTTAPWKCPGRHTLPFLYATNRVRLLLTEQHPQATWRSQQQLKNTEKGSNVSSLPTAELLTESEQRIAIHVMVRLLGTYEHMLIRMFEQLGRNTDDRTPYYTALWYYASGEAEQQLRTARASVATLTTQAIARKISIISYPFQPQQSWNNHRLAVQTHSWSRHEQSGSMRRKEEEP